MLVPGIRTDRTCLGSVAVIVILAGVLFARTALARITFNTIDPVAFVTDTGRHVEVSGPIEVTAGERTWIRVTVTQRSTGAVAEGEVFLTGTGSLQQWELRAETLGKAGFEEGPATAVALARTTTTRGAATDAHQWLVDVTLEPR